MFTESLWPSSAVGERRFDIPSARGLVTTLPKQPHEAVEMRAADVPAEVSGNLVDVDHRELTDDELLLVVET